MTGTATGPLPLRICYLGIGESVHMKRWAGAFAARGHHVSLVTANPDGAPPCGVNVRLISPRLPGKAMKYLEGTFQLRRFLSEYRPDILHAHFLTGYGWWGWWSGFQPLIITVWGKDVYVHPSRGAASRFLASAALRRARLVTGDSENILERAVALRGSPVETRVVQWGVDTEAVRPGYGREETRRRLEIGEEQPVILTNRNFTESFYNNHRIVEAARAVAEKHPGAIFLFLGDGPLRPEVEAQADRLGLAGVARFLGTVPPGDMAAYLGAADIFVSASDVDAPPLSLLEAMAAGLPVVVRRLPSIEEWITGGEGGFLADGDDLPGGLTSGINLLIADKGLAARFGAENRKVAKVRADRKKQMDGMEALYRRIVEENR